MSGCKHPDFQVGADVNRLSDEEGGPITAFAVALRVECAACGEPFAFIGLPVGFSPREPMTSVDAQEVRLPCRPASAPPDWGLDGPGFTVEFIDGAGRPLGGTN